LSEEETEGRKPKCFDKYCLGCIALMLISQNGLLMVPYHANGLKEWYYCGVKTLFVGQTYTECTN